MKDVGKQPNLTQRGGVWHFRKKVPKDVRASIGKREITESLKTGSYKEAAPKARALAAHWDAQFEAARKKLHKPRSARSSVSKHEIRQMASLWLHDIETQQAREALTEPPLSEDDREGEAIDIANTEGALAGIDRDDEHGLVLVSQLVNRLLDQNGIKLEPTDPSYRLLASFARRALMENAKRRRDRLNGHFEHRAHDALFDGVFADSRPPAGSLEDGVTVDQLIERYRKDPARAGLREGTWGKYEIVFRLMREELGAKTLIRDLKREHFTRLKEMMAVLPPNATKTHPKLSFAEVVEVAKRAGLKPMNVVTANNHLSLITTIFSYAHDEDLIDKNPARKLRISSPNTLKKAERRLPFSTEQLTAIFSSGPFAEENRKAPADQDGKFWVPLISLWSGMRLNECCQLAVDDIQKMDGVHVFVVRETGDGRKRVKTEAGVRVVPVHPELQRLGLMQYVAAQREAGHKQLFPELTFSRRGYYSDVFSKWFGKFLKRSGAKKARTSFHSLRHCFRDAMRDAEIAHPIAKALGGWEDGGTDASYGSGYKASTLAKALAKIKYPGLDLSHLHQR